MKVPLPLRELLYLLNGCEGGIFGSLNERDYWNNLENNRFLSSLIEKPEIQIIQELGKLAVDHSVIHRFLRNHFDQACDYELQLHNGIESMINEYQIDLKELESEIDYVTLTSFTKLLKFKLLFKDISEFIESIEKLTYIEIFSLIRIKLDSVHPLVSKSYKRLLRLYKLPFYKDVWNWTVLGQLGCKENHFFISISSDIPVVDKENIPSFLNQESISRIHLSGKLIRFFSDNYGLSFETIFDDKYDEIEKQYLELCEDEDFNDHDLSHFIKEISSHVFKYSYFHLMQKEKIPNYIQVIKSNHLLGNQSFWLNFIQDLSNVKSYKGVYNLDYWMKNFQHLWKKNLTDFFNEEQYEQFVNIVQIKSVQICTATPEGRFEKKDKITEDDVVVPIFSFNYRLPVMVKMVINEMLFEKYDVIFNFCFQLCQAMCLLSKCWKCSIRQRQRKKIDFIRFRLMIVLENIFYFYKVNVIERLYCKFLTDMDKFQDIFTMELCHHNFVLNLMKESLLNIEQIRETFQSILCFCHKLHLSFRRDLPLADRETEELEKEINELYMKLYYQFTNVRSYELSPSLSQLLFQIGKILMFNENKLSV